MDILADYLLRLEADEEIERARAGDEPAPNTLEVTEVSVRPAAYSTTETSETELELDNHRIQQFENSVCF